MGGVLCRWKSPGSSSTEVKKAKLKITILVKEEGMDSDEEGMVTFSPVEDAQVALCVAAGRETTAVGTSPALRKL